MRNAYREEALWACMSICILACAINVRAGCNSYWDRTAPACDGDCEKTPSYVQRSQSTSGDTYETGTEAPCQYCSARSTDVLLKGPTRSMSTDSSSSSDENASATVSNPSKDPFWYNEEEMPCAPDILELGRASWTLIHTMAATYPDDPTPEQQQIMTDFFLALGEFFPCKKCAAHLKKELQKRPPKVENREALSLWACKLHNLVNVYLKKPDFDCGKVFQRWRDGAEMAH